MEMRDAMQRIESRLGPYYLRHVYPGNHDSTSAESRTFFLRFARPTRLAVAQEAFDSEAVLAAGLIHPGSPIFPASSSLAEHGHSQTMAIRPNLVEAGSNMQVDLAADAARTVRVELVDLFGRTLTELVALTEGAPAHVNIRTGGLTPGMYFVRAERSVCPVLILLKKGS